VCVGAPAVCGTGSAAGGAAAGGGAGGAAGGCAAVAAAETAIIKNVNGAKKTHFNEVLPNIHKFLVSSCYEK